MRGSPSCVATALANSEAHDELTRLADEQAALRRVATLVAAGAQPFEVFEAVSAEVAALIGADGSAVTRYEADGTITAVSSWTPEGGYSDLETHHTLEGTVSGLILETGKPGRIDNYAEGPGEGPKIARELGVHSSVGAPITVQGRLWGVLVVISNSEELLPRETEQRLAEFTELFATAIANTEANEELARLAEEQAALRRVATLVAAGAQPAEVFEAVSAEVAALIAADGAAVTRYEADGTFTTVSGWTPEGGFSSLGIRYPLEGSVAGLILETGRPGRVDRIADAQGEAQKAAREMGFRSSVGAPITVEGRLWGVLAVASKSEQPLPRDTEQRLAEFAELFATAIANSEAHEQLEQLADEQAALRRVATLVATGAPPAEVFEAVSAEVAALIARGRLRSHALRGRRDRHRGERLDDRGRVQVRREALRARRHRVGRDPRDRPARSRRELRRSAGRGPEAAREMGWRSSVGAPITVEGRLWGALAVVSKSEQPLPARHRAAAGRVRRALRDRDRKQRGARAARAARRRTGGAATGGHARRRGSDAAQVFDAVRHEVARMFDAPLSVLIRYDANGTATVLATADGYLGPIGRSWPVEGDGSAIARVCRTGLPARADYTQPAQGPIAAAARAVGARSAVACPVVVDGTLWGVMAVGSRETEPLPADFEGRLAKFTELLATAIANAEGRAELDASRARIVNTADATRRRIERDLHDGAQQQLVWLALALRAAQATVPEELEQHRSELGRVVDGLTAALDDLREIALGIHPAGLSEDGLKPALKRLVARSPLRVNLDFVPMVASRNRWRWRPTTSSRSR